MDVVSQPHAGDIDRQVLAAVAPAGSAISAVACRLGQPDESVRWAVSRLAQAGLVEVAGDYVRLARSDRRVGADLGPSTPEAAGPGVPTIDLNEVARLVGSLWPTHFGRAAEEERRNGMLAADVDRDRAVRLLSDAFAQGRLSSAELENRTTGALTARTYGALDQALQGLEGLPRPAKGHPVRRACFWVVALMSFPFLLLGAMLLAFGVDVGDRVGGVVFLVLFLPGLLALRRWAWPRRRYGGHNRL